MKVGLIVRAEDRGLGTLSREFYRHLRPDRTLLIIPDAVQKAGLTSHVGWYPDATRVRFGAVSRRSLAVGELCEEVCRPWLEGLDVVLTFETFYDWRLVRWAREVRCATVCMAMPEFCRPEWLDQPSRWWVPTTYLLDRMPPATRVVPVPVPTDRWAWQGDVNMPPRWLHVAGAQTIADRNGTATLLRALTLTTEQQDVTVRTQDQLSVAARFPSNVRVHFDTANVPDYWTMYEGFDALVLPRRYAGLCLPVIEAMGAGLAIVMTDMEPQRSDWPTARVLTHEGDPIRLAGGMIPTGNADPRDLANLMDEWARSSELVRFARGEACAYARIHAWDHQRDNVLRELEAACD